MVIIHSSLNTCFDRHDIHNCKNVNWVSYTWFGVTWRRFVLQYTGCNRRNGPDFGRVFLMLNDTEKPQNTFIQSWTVTEIMARETFGFLLGPPTVPVSWEPYLRYLRECGVMWRKIAQGTMLFLPVDDVISRVTSALSIHVCYSAGNTKDNYDMSASFL
jgi:hypothetical protein